MFKYSALSLNVYGFKKIKYLDDSKLIFEYRNKLLIVYGIGLKIINLLDNSLEIKGIVEKIEISYLGDSND